MLEAKTIYISQIEKRFANASCSFMDHIITGKIKNSPTNFALIWITYNVSKTHLIRRKQSSFRNVIS